MNKEKTKNMVELLDLMINNIKTMRIARDKDKGHRLYPKKHGARRLGTLVWARCAAQALLIKGE